MTNLGVASSAFHHGLRRRMAALFVSLPVLAGCSGDDGSPAGPPGSTPDARGIYVGTFTSVGEDSSNRAELVCSGSIVVSTQAGTDWSGNTTIDDGGNQLCAATEDEAIAGTVTAGGAVSFVVPSVEADCGATGLMTGTLVGDVLAVEGSWVCGSLQITSQFNGER